MMSGNSVGEVFVQVFPFIGVAIGQRMCEVGQVILLSEILSGPGGL